MPYINRNHHTMNFVGHIYLSGNNDKIAIGNFIGDYVKGGGYNHFPEDIRQGILIHRDIDSTMDLHPSFTATRELLREPYGKYAGVVVDIAFDYILTKNWVDWHDAPLKRFTRRFYGILLMHYRILPSRVKEFLPFMIQSNRLYTYSSLIGIEKALNIMSSYTSLPDRHREGIAIINKHEKEITQYFYKLLCDLSLYLNKKYALSFNEKATVQIEKYRTLNTPF